MAEEIVVRGSGGGCFRAGTLVQLEYGKTCPINEVLVGDIVLSYDEEGTLHLSKVTAVHYHKDPEPLINVSFWGGEVDITPNHWVLNQYGTFAEISSLTEEDALVDGMGHLRPIKKITPILPEPVWNLTVEPNHTFITNNIRVHNGGYRERFPTVQGSGGGGGKGGGGSARVAVESPDSLHSKQYAKVIDLISEGEIEGLVDGLKSIYLDETPIQSSTGTMNFSGVTVDYRSGTQSQSYIPSFGSVEAETNVSAEILKNFPVVRTITNPNADAVRITIGVPSLTYQDMTTGDISGTSVTLTADINTNGGGWVPLNFSTKTEYLPIVSGVAVPRTISGSNVQIVGATVNISWTGVTSTSAPQSCSYTTEYRTSPNGPWITIASSTLSGTITTSVVYTETYVYWGGSGGEESGQYYLVPSTVITAPTKTKSHYISLPRNAYNFRVVKTSGTGTVSVGSVASIEETSSNTISGKTTSKYQRSFKVLLPGDGPWDIRISRTTADSTTSNLRNSTWWESYTEIIDSKLAYPNSALVALSIDSEQFSSIPSRGYDIKGLKVRIPNNYNPVTREYTGIWNGTFKTAWTDNPAWCFYDMLTNDRYGLGTFIADSQVDKWQLYTISQYCDELVPSGFGTMEPRFTCNLYLQTREEAYKVINAMASIFRAMVFWSSGTIFTSQDAPSDPVALFTPANVIEGKFSYEGSSIKARHTVALVSWNDPKDRYKQRIEYVEDEQGIDRYGVIETTLLAVGCTSRGQAHRLGRWLLYTERLETEVVTFKTGLDGTLVSPGSIIKTTDPIRSGNRRGGRLLSASTTQVVLDSSIGLSSLESYTLWVVLPDGTVTSRSAAYISGSTLNVSPAFPEAPQANSIWVISSAALIPETWRVVSTKETENAQIEIVALAYREDKFLAVENDLFLEDLNTSGIALIPSRPAAGIVSDTIYINGSTIQTKMVVSWEPNREAYRYRVQYKRVNENWIDLPDQTNISVDIPNVVDGADYIVRVFSINAIGRLSADYLEFEYRVLGKTVPPSNVEGFTSTIERTGVVLSWNDITDIDRYDFGLHKGSTWGEPIQWISATALTLPVQLAGIHTYKLKARDTTENLSEIASSTSFTILVPSTPTITTALSEKNLIASWNDCVTSHSIQKYAVKVDTGNYGWNALPVITEVSGVSATIPVTWVGSAKVLVRAIDIAGNQSATGTVTLSVSVPAAPIVTVSTIGADALISWNIPTSSLPIVSYEIRYGSSWATGASIGKITASSIKYVVDWLGSRQWWVAAIDSAGNVGIAGTSTLLISMPSTPVISHTFETSSCRLQWPSASTSLPIDYYEVRRGASWNTAASLGKAYSDNFSIIVDWAETATFLVRAVDLAGNVGTEGVYTVSVSSPLATPILHSFSGTDCVLTWNSATSGALPIAGYEVRTGVSWETGSLVGITQDNILRTAGDWAGNRTFFLKVFDTAGAYGGVSSTTANIGGYSAPTGISITQSLTDIVIKWNTATGGQLPIDYYEIRFGSIWASAEVVGKSKSNTITIPITWTGSRTFWVHAVDTSNNIGNTSSQSFSVSVPGSVSVTNTIVAAKAQLTWTAPVSQLPIAHYDIRSGASWAAGTPLTTQAGTDYRVSVNWAGSKTFWVNTIDVNNNPGVAGNTVVNVIVPQTPVVSAVVDLDSFILNWTQPSATLPIINYEIRYGTSWATGTEYGISNTNTISVKGSWLGTRTFWVAAIDVNGNYGTAGSVTTSITAPLAPTGYRQEVVDNNVLLYWNQVTGTMPTETYELRRGATWGTATLIGQKAGGFTTIFETSAGTFTYWIAAIDSAGNYGTPTSLVCVVNTPPDYVLKLNMDSTFSGTKTNIRVDQGVMFLPVNTTEIFSTHFTSRSWAGPQAQVTANYPVYVQPNLTPATYVETVDYGTVLAANKITLTLNTETITGSIAVTTTISTSTDNVSWTDFPGVLQTFATNFRYVKFTIVCTAADDKALMKILGINLRMDSKLKTTTSTVACIAPVTGTYIQNGTTSITVTAAGTYTTGQYVDLDFTTGTSLDGIYIVTSGGTGTFTVTHSTVLTTSGSVNIDSTGTPLYLTDTRQHTGAKTFIDVDAVQVTGAGTTPLVAMYNFVDIANPLYLKVLLFNTSGTRVAGTASVTVRGF
jgi:predicted phage tail protein